MDNVSIVIFLIIYFGAVMVIPIALLTVTLMLALNAATRLFGKG